MSIVEKLVVAAIPGGIWEQLFVFWVFYNPGLYTGILAILLIGSIIGPVFARRYEPRQFQFTGAGTKGKCLSISAVSMRTLGRHIRQYSVSHEFKEYFKSSMARISTQAMILTAGYKSKDKRNAVLHGMTLSSVCSLSLFPKPLLQFNLHLPSYTSQSLHQNQGILAIHVLPPTPKSVKLGRIFASGVKKEEKNHQGMCLGTTQQELKDGEVFHEMTTPFKNIGEQDWEEHRYNNEISIPVVKEAERVFIGRKREVFEIDSHEIWAVEVEKIICPNEKFTAGRNDDMTGGILYFNRAFHKVGQVLDEN